MGYDDGVCELAPDGQHDLQPDVLLIRDEAGVDRQLRCVWCGGLGYEASAADDPRRPPL